MVVEIIIPGALVVDPCRLHEGAHPVEGKGLLRRFNIGQKLEVAFLLAEYAVEGLLTGETPVGGVDDQAILEVNHPLLRTDDNHEHTRSPGRTDQLNNIGGGEVAQTAFQLQYKKSL